jgi:hypothetical protein
MQIKRGGDPTFSLLKEGEGVSPYTGMTKNVGYPPKNLINPPSYVNNPFGQEEYVGPNSMIFANPYQNQPPFPGSVKIPPGARYDPVDPFDNPH